MRVISSNGNINVPYENYMFELHVEDDHKTACITVMSFKGNRVLGEYPVEQARQIFNELIASGKRQLNVYRMPKEEVPWS